MSGSARVRHAAEFIRSMYPAFSRRATQVCILSGALEKIALGATNTQDIALAALDQADAFGWKQRRNAGVAPSHTPSGAEAEKLRRALGDIISQTVVIERMGSEDWQDWLEKNRRIRQIAREALSPAGVAVPDGQTETAGDAHG